MKEKLRGLIRRANDYIYTVDDKRKRDALFCHVTDKLRSAIGYVDMNSIYGIDTAVRTLYEVTSLLNFAAWVDVWPDPLWREMSCDLTEIIDELTWKRGIIVGREYEEGETT